MPGRPLRITWVLPRFQSFPSGGYRVVYEYANHLAARGHRISVVHPLALEPSIRLDRWWRRSAWRARVRRLRDRGQVTWFDVDPRVDMRTVRSLEERHVPPGDAIVATAWQTAKAIASYDESADESSSSSSTTRPGAARTPRSTRSGASRSTRS